MVVFTFTPAVFSRPTSLLTLDIISLKFLPLSGLHTILLREWAREMELFSLFPATNQGLPKMN